MVVVIEAEDTSDFLLESGQNLDCVLAAASAAHPAHFHLPGFFDHLFSFELRGGLSVRG